jgi:hypothetical protein
MPCPQRIDRCLSFAAVLFAIAGLAASSPAQGRPGHAGSPAASMPDWSTLESTALRNPVQLTFDDRFAKAGESYFSPDDAMVVFQAVEAPAPGETADDFYAMFVAEVVRDAHGRVIALENERRISPPGSANTCGWFHPAEAGVVLFGSTIGPPTESAPPGYQRASGRYRWMFPPEMDIVQVSLATADGTAASLQRIIRNDEGYLAECSYSRDGRHLLYCSLETNEGDLYVKDRQSGNVSRIVSARGYDGGPFFSPDQKRICYRSDRRGNHELQLFVADLAFNEDGSIIGIEREYQLTDNGHVNWCPFWLPDGRHLVYATSADGHHNYEIYLIDADPGTLPGSDGTIRYGTRPRRITQAPGADVLPAFTSDGRTMIWTSKRGAESTSQLWAAEFVIDPDAY